MNGKVFGIGMSKTGTTSLYAALARLGYRSGTFRHLRNLGLNDWLAGDFTPDYLTDFDAVTDLPVGCWFRELDARYPDSRFILTHRDMDSWVESIGQQFSGNTNPGPFMRYTRVAAYGFTVFNAAAFRQRHHRHIAEVREHFAGTGRLLEVSFFDGDGWDQICGFLGNEIPAEDFPNVKPGYKA